VDQPTPDDYQPRLTWWSHTWRTVLMLAISAIVWISVVEGQAEEHHLQFWFDVVLGLVGYALVWWRRRQPVAIAVITCALSAASGIAAGPATLAMVSLATHRQLRQILPLAALNLAAATIFVNTQPVADPLPAWIDFSVNTVIISAMVAWGMYVGSRRELIWTLRNRAETAEAEQELRAREARTVERARIAREMHDVLAHRISQISMHAGALSFREDLTADEMRDSVAVIREKAHEALTDLRGVLGVLRDDGTGRSAEAPQPTYADLPALVAEADETGLDVTFHDDLDRRGMPVPDTVGRTLFRIVQEGITNARKHAPGSRLTIDVTGSPEGGVDIRMRNPIGFGPSAAPGAGLGLVGLTERAALAGGRLDHRRDGQTFLLHAWIPWSP
jgi:signal transduction histidine kinase